MQQPSDVSNRRLLWLLADIADRCAAMPRTRPAVDDAALTLLLANLWELSDVLGDTTVHCWQSGLTAEASRLREFRGRLEQYGSDAVLSAMARGESPEGISVLQQKYGAFSIPIDDPETNDKREEFRWTQLLGTIEQLRRYASSVLKSTEGSVDGLQDVTHSPDFRSVRWFDTDYTFTPNQAAIVKQLWEARESGTPEVGGQTLLETAGINGNRFDSVFRGHSAWQVMIASGGTKGSYRLQEPDEPSS